MTQSMRFDARTLSAAWLSVAIASGDDPERPALYRTTSIEWFPTGVRLVATDSVMLLTSWAGADDAPELDEAPLDVTTAIDENGRGAALFAHLWKLATAKDALPFEVELSDEPSSASDGALDGMEGRSVVIDHPDHERVELSVYDAPYPAWRGLMNGVKPKATASVALAPKVLSRLSKLGRWHGGPLRCHLHGAEKAVRVEMHGSDPEVEGLVMPVKVT